MAMIKWSDLLEEHGHRVQGNFIYNVIYIKDLFNFVHAGCNLSANVINNADFEVIRPSRPRGVLICSVGGCLSRRAPPRGLRRVLMRMAPGVPKLSGSGMGSGMACKPFRALGTAFFMVAKPTDPVGLAVVTYSAPFMCFNLYIAK